MGAELMKHAAAPALTLPRDIGPRYPMVTSSPWRRFGRGRPAIPSSLSRLNPKLCDLIQELWSSDPANRPAFTEVYTRLENLAQLGVSPKRREVARRASVARRNSARERASVRRASIKMIKAKAYDTEQLIEELAALRGMYDAFFS